jgi:hypothetical protein
MVAERHTVWIFYFNLTDVSITITHPSGAGNRIGPGYGVSFHENTAIAVTGHGTWTIDITDQAVPVTLIRDNYPYTGQTLLLYVGMQGLIDHLSNLVGQNANTIIGADVVLTVIVNDASISFSDFASQHQTWDPTGQLYQLLSYIPLSPDLQTILNAVRRTYQNAP